MIFDTSPIAAITTAPGRGGIGIVRISGKDLSAFLRAMHLQLTPRHATFTAFTDHDGSIIDQGIALYFKAPHSYTGEDILELQGHGGPIVLQLLLARCLEVGKEIDLRLAQPGEFTQRAFQNDKLDLAQAEAVADLIDASTKMAAKSASLSLSGAFSDIVHTLVNQLIDLRMLVESTLDFPEEEIDFLEKSNARLQLANISETVRRVLLQAKQGALLREGLNIVLAGQPNVGKSSLLNVLAGSDVAIVTPIAGTTRDKVVETIQIEGIPLHIIDTAGIREDEDAHDEVERIGIARTWAELHKADVILHILDAGKGPTREDEKISARFPANVPVICVWNKIDLSGHKPSLDQLEHTTHVYLSAAHNVGIDLLRQELLRIAGWEQTNESIYLARERHLIALNTANEHLDAAIHFAAQQDKALDLLAEELRLAQEKLNSITGEFTPDDLLGVIFSRFCIGK